MASVALYTAGGMVVGAWAYLRHIQLPRGPTRTHWTGLVFGHRGCKNVPGIPENTIKAYTYAYNNHVSGIELDVRVTKDDVCVSFHDMYLNRLIKDVSADLKISDLTFDEVRKLRFIEDPSDTVIIPTLEEVLDFCREKHLKVLIELKELKKKDVVVKKLLELYKQHGEDYMYEETMVISFNPGSLYALRKQDPKIATCSLYSGTLLQTAVSDPRLEPLPFYFRYGTRWWDWLLLHLQTTVLPWLGGVSCVGPADHQYSHSSWNLWRKRNVAMYVWGITKPEGHHDQMKSCDGLFICADDQHHLYFREK